MNEEEVEAAADNHLTITKETSSSSSKQPPKGTASVFKTFLLLFKALVGSGVLFLPRAFYNGGMLFSMITLSLFGLLTFLLYWIN